MIQKDIYSYKFDKIQIVTRHSEILLQQQSGITLELTVVDLISSFNLQGASLDVCNEWGIHNW